MTHSVNFTHAAHLTFPVGVWQLEGVSPCLDVNTKKQISPKKKNLKPPFLLLNYSHINLFSSFYLWAGTEKFTTPREQLSPLLNVGVGSAPIVPLYCIKRAFLCVYVKLW